MMYQRKKRVLMVVNSPMNIAGVQNVVMAIILNLHKQFTFDVLTYSNEKGFYDKEIEKYGGNVYTVLLDPYKNYGIFYLKRIRQLEGAVKKICLKKHYDIIHCHNGIEAGACLKAGALCNVPVRICHTHGNYSFRTKNPIIKEYYKICDRYMKHYTTLRLACSETSGRSLFHNEDFFNVLNPINYQYFHSIKRTKHDGINLIQIGYYNRNKNQLFSVKLLKELINKGKKCHLFFIGFILDNDYYNSLLSFINENGLIEFVTLYPSDYDKKSVLNITDYMLLPSYTEGLPLVALESQAANIPIICSNGVPRDVDFGGCFFPGPDVKDWAETIVNNLNTNYTISTDIENLDSQKYSSRIASFYTKGLI